MNDTEQKGWKSVSKWPFYVFLAIGGYFLWTEHQAHFIEYLPLTLIAACIGMHFFMHGSHGRHHGPKDHDTGSHNETNRSLATSDSNERLQELRDMAHKD